MALDEVLDLLKVAYDKEPASQPILAWSSSPVPSLDDDAWSGAG